MNSKRLKNKPDELLNNAIEEMSDLIRSFIPVSSLQPYDNQASQLTLPLSKGALGESKFNYLSPKIAQQLEDQGVDPLIIDAKVAKILSRDLLIKIFQISKILSLESIIFKNRNKLPKEKRARVEKLIKWRGKKQNQLYFRQNIYTTTKDSAWMTRLLTKLAKELNLYFENQTGRGIQKNPAIRYKTLQFISDFFNDLAGSKLYEPKLIRSRIKKEFEHKLL